MYKYIIKRILYMIPVFLLALLVVYGIMEMTPGDPAKIILGKSASQEMVNQLRSELGLDDPFIIRYFRYIGNALKGDLGKSYVTGLPVINEVAVRLPVSLKLTFFCVLISMIIGIPIGIISAVKQYSFIDNLSTGFALAMASIPDFWLGLMLILIFSLKLNIFPSTGSDSLVHFILPSITLSALSTAILVRMTRSTMLEVIRQDYIRTAKAKGASKGIIIREHALPNALIPIVTEIGGDICALLVGTILVEAVFGMSGIGTLLLTGTRNKDVPVVLGGVMLFSIAASIINLVVDISYAFIDPRIKANYK